MNNNASLKVTGQNGQISLGKKFAGRHIQVDEREPGVWLIRTVTQARRATAYRDAAYMRFLTIQVDHDSTYGKK